MPPKKKKRPLKERRRRARMLALFALAFAVLALLASAVIGLRRPEITIASVEVFGTAIAREDLVHRQVTDLLHGSYLFLIPRANTFFYPHARIVKDIKSTFLPVKDVRVSRSGFTALSVRVKEREAAALWCRPASNAQPADVATEAEEAAGAPTRCFLMDEDGFVFAPAQGDTAPAELLRFLGKLSADPLGETYLSGSLGTLRIFLDKLARAAKRTPGEVLVDEHDDVYVRFAESGEVRFTRADQSDALLDNIASVFASSRFAEDDELDYADFRFGSKIYVKFVGE